MPVLKWLRRSLLVASALLMALAAIAPVVRAQEDPDAGRPSSFQASAYTTGLEVFFNTPSAVDEVLRLSIPHGDSEFAAGARSIARSASLWPGLTVAKGANLICATDFPCEDFAEFPTGFPPEWPFVAEAQYPTNLDAEAQASGQTTEMGPLTFTTHVVEAHAGRDFVSTRAVVKDVDLLPMPGASGTGLRVVQEVNPSLLHVGTLESRTLHHFAEDVLVAYSESRLAGISLFGGQLQIEKLVARSTSRNDGDTVLESSPRVTVEGATLGGVPVEISSRGVLVDGEPRDDGLIRALGTGFKELTDGEIRLVDGSTIEDEGRTDGDATGLMVRFVIDASGFPGGTDLFGHLILGLSSTSARVGGEPEGFDDFDFGLDDFDSGDDGGFTGASSTGGGEGTTDGDFEVAGETVTRPPGSGAPAPGVTSSVTSRTFPLELLSGLTASRMELLYAAWTLAVIGFALGSRARPFRLAPIRRP